jgi:hypothetical protein
MSWHSLVPPTLTMTSSSPYSTALDPSTTHLSSLSQPLLIKPHSPSPTYTATSLVMSPNSKVRFSLPLVPSHHHTILLPLQLDINLVIPIDHNPIPTTKPDPLTYFKPIFLQPNRADPLIITNQRHIPNPLLHHQLPASELPSMPISPLIITPTSYSVKYVLNSAMLQKNAIGDMNLIHLTKADHPLLFKPM